MQPVNDLKMEHDAVRLTLQILDAICLKIEKSGKIDAMQHLDQLLAFFRVFVDKCHHSKEEELLFPALENIGVSREGGPIGVMLNEHQQGREYVRAMQAALAQYSAMKRTAIDEFVKTAKAYISLLNQHIDKENGVLFPLAERHLSEPVQMKLQQGFEKIETEKIGAGQHDEFHKMMDNLARVYLG